MDRKQNLYRNETFSFVNPWIRYFLFFFSFLFWVSTVLLLKDYFWQKHRGYVYSLIHMTSYYGIVAFQKSQTCKNKEGKGKKGKSLQIINEQI